MSKADVGCQRCVCARCVLRARWSLGLRVCELLFTTTRLWGPRVFLASIRRNCCFGWSTFAFLVVAFTLLRSSIRKWPVTKNKHKKTHQRKKPDQKQKTKNTHKTRTKKGKKKKKNSQRKERGGTVGLMTCPVRFVQFRPCSFCFGRSANYFVRSLGTKPQKKKKSKKNKKENQQRKSTTAPAKTINNRFKRLGGTTFHAV